jgi:hypothetical protein
MIKRLHHQARSLLFKSEKRDWPFLVQVVLLLLLIGYPIYSGAVILSDAVAFDILFIVFIFYGIILIEKPSVYLLVSGICAIIALLVESSQLEIRSEGAAFWFIRIEVIMPIVYFALLGLRLVGDTLAEKVSLKLIYISITNYFTIGILYSFVYQLIHITHAQAFNFSPEIKYNYLYMSFVILSTVGLGDMLPTSVAAKSAVVLEAITGQLYLAFFVALTIGKYLAEYSSASGNRTSS